MALPTISAASFIGWVNIVANQFKEEKLEEYITLFLAQYLRQIVGDAAFIDIEAQTRQKWTDLLEGVNYVNAEGKRKTYGGLTAPLTYFIYFEFIRDNFTSTQTGKVIGKSENSERATDLEVLNVARSRFNQGVFSVNSQTPNFLEANEKFEEGVTASNDEGDNTYTLSIPNTKYLEAGENVTINGVTYPVTAVTEDVSIIIDAGQLGLDFTGDLVSWEPYGDLEFCEMVICGI